MQRHQAFKYELMPSGERQRDMRRFAGSRRLLALQKTNYEAGSGLGRKTRTKPASVKQEPTEATMHEVTHA